MLTDAQRLLKAITAIEPRIFAWTGTERVAAEHRTGSDAGDMTVIGDPRYGAVLDAAETAHAALNRVRALVEDPTLEVQ